MAMLVFMAALRRELSPLQTLVQVQRRATVRGCTIAQGAAGDATVALAWFGIGRQRAQEGFQAVMESCRPEAIINIGFAGGVQPEARVGDLVLGERVYRLEPAAAADAASPMGAGLSADGALLEAAALTVQDGEIPAHQGDLLTVSEVFGPALKRWVGDRFPIKAVDMESYWIAEAAAERSIPFLAVRAVSDEAGDVLPEYGRFEDEMGKLQPLNAILYFSSHPRHLMAAPRLAGAARRAGASLGAFAALFLPRVYGYTRERSHG